MGFETFLYCINLVIVDPFVEHILKKKILNIFYFAKLFYHCIVIVEGDCVIYKIIFKIRTNKFI